MTDPVFPLPPRVPTGIEGLDRILFGGLLRGGLYLIMGSPGAGKTTLGNQIAFSHIAANPKQRVVYVTLLAETHAHMLNHLQSFSFFSRDPIAQSIYYLSGYDTLEAEGLRGLLTLLRQAIRDHKATLLVLDGLTTAELMASSEINFKRFTLDLQAMTDTLGCTALLLSNTPPIDQPHPAYTMVDGLIALQQRLVGAQEVRELQVIKSRGSRMLGGLHRIEITGDGVVVYPRIEAVLAQPSMQIPQSRVRRIFGVPHLDTMLGGGLLSGTTTVVQGAPGSGKTLLGLHFLSAALDTEPALHFGFYERPERLISAARSIGLNLQPALDSGNLEMLWQPPLATNPDALAERLLTAINRRNVRRIFVDGLEGFWESTHDQDRTIGFFTALANELRARDVTVIFTAELRQMFGATIPVPTQGVSAIVENIILMRYVELRSRLYRLISILKERETGYDTAIREFTISSDGIDVAQTFDSAEAILTGIGQQPPHRSATFSSANPPDPAP